MSKSALGRANEQLDHRFYCGLFSRLYARYEGKGGGHPFRFKGKLFSLDGSLFNVAMEIFPWANYNNKKAAFKLHLGLDHNGLIPAFASVTLGKESEMSRARLFDFPEGSVVVFDKGYSDYTWHDALTGKGVFFVTSTCSCPVAGLCLSLVVPRLSFLHAWRRAALAAILARPIVLRPFILEPCRV